MAVRQSVPQSIPVVWREADSDAAGVGRLELVGHRLQLVGSRRGQAVSEEVPFDEIKSAERARAFDERIGGAPTLVLELRNQGRLLISSVFGVGVLAEVVEQLLKTF